MGFNLDDYVDVPTRLKELLAEHPQASVVADAPKLITVNDSHFVEVTVTITDGDRMARASAWEPYPGKTPYTKDSEMMNAETSALGRCCGLWGYGIKKSVASLDEVRARRAESVAKHPASQPKDVGFADRGETQSGSLATEKQLNAIKAMHRKLGKTLPVGLEAFSKDDASAHISFLNEQLGAKSD
jgi:hypothetical protein